MAASSLRLTVALVVAALLAGGCSSGAARQGAARPVSGRKVKVSTAGPATSPADRQASRAGPGGPTAGTDACANRLHDLCLPLLMYYVTNKRLPERLDELAPFADDPAAFKTTCPVSGQPYAYTPPGLPASGTDRVLLVYDPTPAHGGFRWVILASAPQGDQPLSTWVMPYTEERFRRHQPK